MELKAVKPDELVKGKLYCDIDNINTFSTVLKFLSKGEDYIFFEYVSGACTYLGYNGVIKLNICGDESDLFYELPNQ